MHYVSERILLTLWVGGMWTIGFIVAPVLFSTLDDRSLAGSIAGRLFGLMSYVGLVCGVLILLAMVFKRLNAAKKDWRIWIVLLMLLLIIVGQFVLTPQMAALREAGLQTAEKARFDLYHSISTILFSINALAGLVLVVFQGTRQTETMTKPE